MIGRALLVLLLAGCGEHDEERESAEPAQTPDVPRGPHGAGPASCDGASDDPRAIETIDAQAETDLDGAIEAMEALVGANPGSATARVRLGELWLRKTPPAARDARGWFERALALHESGCTLGRRDEWGAREGMALSQIIEGHYDRALPILRGSLERWPDVSSTRYNLACALCRTGDIDGCERELTSVVANEGRAPPSWLEDRRQPGGRYRQMASTDPDLAPLRAEPERFDRAMGR